MTTFTSEEMDFLRDRGNDYSKQVWLALFEGNVLTESSDEQEIRDFMIQKYERKRYYVDPKVSGVQFRSTKQTNGSTSSSAENVNNVNEDEFLKNWKSMPQSTNNNNGIIKNNKSILRDRNQIRNGGTPPVISTPPLKITAPSNGTNGCGNGASVEFVADFSKADIFVAESTTNGSLFNGNNNNNTQTAFANFDNNPIFNGSGKLHLNIIMLIFWHGLLFGGRILRRYRIYYPGTAGCEMSKCGRE